MKRTILIDGKILVNKDKNICGHYLLNKNPVKNAQKYEN